ncbi:MAG: hypothetical protein IKF91_00865 [Bacilli bacterium]|nr:hypothetical protein [Bacilli bacterium]
MKKNIVIAILLIAVVLMGGTFYYLYTNQDKILNKCNCPKSKCDEKAVEKNDNTKIEEEANINSDTKANGNGLIDAVYSYTSTESATTVVLFSTGKCVETNAMEYRVCEYEIEGNKINMHFEADMTHDNPYTITYDLLDNNNIKLSGSQNNIELKRLQ